MTPPRTASTPMSRLTARNGRPRRLALELSAARFAEAMTEEGLPWRRATVVNTEGGRRNLTLDELFGMAVVLGCSPLDLIIPPESEEPFRPTPRHEPMTPDQARVWIVGRPRSRMMLVDSAAMIAGA